MGRNDDQHDDQHEPNTDKIDDEYSEVDPDDVAEDGVDYFRGKPRTESEKAEKETS